MNPERVDPLPQITEEEVLRAKGQMQIELIKISAGEDEAKIFAWINKASSNFNNYIHTRPDLVLLWRDSEQRGEVIRILQEAEKTNFEIL